MTQDRFDPVRIGIVSISDRASSGVYEDKGLPALKDWLVRALKNPITFDARLIPDEKDGISAALIETMPMRTGSNLSWVIAALVLLGVGVLPG